MRADSLKSRLPAGVWMLGFVSLFMDISSEMIHGLLPVFMVTTLGATALAVGVVDGVAEGTASIMRLFSGIGSDRMGLRKPLAVLGYGLSALSKPLFPLAHGALAVLAARFADRIGKGIRTAPRDALIADLTAPDQRGAAYGLRQSLDTVGAFVGPLLAMLLMALLDDDMRKVFAIAVVPALICVAILVLGVKEPPRSEAFTPPRFDRTALRALPQPFWRLLLASAPFTFASFSEGFLVLRAQERGLALALIPMTLVVMNVMYGSVAYPVGKWSDRVPRVLLMLTGCAVLLVANACLAYAPSLGWVAVGAALWGVQLGFTEGLIAALVSDYAPGPLRGTAFGTLHFVRGICLVSSSVLAGELWTHFGPPATFIAGGVFAMLTALALLPLTRPEARA